MTIFETTNFIVKAPSKPLVSREEGGHVMIAVKDQSITDRTKISPMVAIEFMRLSIIVGAALETALTKIGIPIIKVNYQDMGNWTYKENKPPFLHYHIFGRVLNAPKQPFPEAVNLPDRASGFYEGFHPLTQTDADEILQEITKLFSQQKFSDEAWGL